MSDNANMETGEKQVKSHIHEARQCNLDQVDEKDFRPDPARHHIGEDYPKVEKSHLREDPYH